MSKILAQICQQEASKLFQETCLNIITNYTKSEPEVTISFTYIQPAPVVLTMF